MPPPRSGVVPVDWGPGTMTRGTVRVHSSEIVEEHVHPPGGEIWLPADITTVFTLATGLAVGTFPAAWTVILDPTPGLFIDIHRTLLVNLPPADGAYEIEFGAGAIGNEVTLTAIRTFIDAVGVHYPRTAELVYCPRIPAGTRLCARMRCSVAGVQVADFQFSYHRYLV